MMRVLSDRELLAHVAGALDPGDATAVEAAIAADPHIRHRHDALSARVRALTGGDGWVLPVLALPGRVPPPRVSVGAAMYLGDGGVHPGDHVKLAVVPQASAADVRPVVVHVHAGASGVLYPLNEEEWVTLDTWPEANGAREVDIIAGAEPGEHRYVVVLVDIATPVDWSAPGESRWLPIREAAEDGRVSAASLTVIVE